jgi:nicotinamidase-related amidase
MSANLCTEAHLRELLERGFEVVVVKDGTAAAIVPEGNGNEAALVNFRFAACIFPTQAITAASIQKYRSI